MRSHAWISASWEDKFAGYFSWSCGIESRFLNLEVRSCNIATDLPWCQVPDQQHTGKQALQSTCMCLHHECNESTMAFGILSCIVDCGIVFSFLAEDP